MTGVLYSKTFALVGLALTLATPAPSSVQAANVWPDTYRARVEMLALIETLDASILGSPSATATLEAWCADHAMAIPPTIVARLMPGSSKPATDEQRERLGIGPTEPIKYRHVALSCGTHVLSVADNWYVPARLTPAMNATLDTTDVPFGRVVASLKPSRRTIAAIRLWSPLPAGWDMREVPDDRPPSSDSVGKTVDLPDFLLEHHAILYTADRTPFAEVHEHYTNEILGFGHHTIGTVAKP